MRDCSSSLVTFASSSALLASCSSLARKIMSTLPLFSSNISAWRAIAVSIRASVSGCPLCHCARLTLASVSSRCHTPPTNTCVKCMQQQNRTRPRKCTLDAALRYLAMVQRGRQLGVCSLEITHAL